MSVLSAVVRATAASRSLAASIGTAEHVGVWSAGGRVPVREHQAAVDDVVPDVVPVDADQERHGGLGYRRSPGRVYPTA